MLKVLYDNEADDHDSIATTIYCVLENGRDRNVENGVKYHTL